LRGFTTHTHSQIFGPEQKKNVAKSKVTRIKKEERAKKIPQKSKNEKGR
jgi:hypothetical protein